MYFTPTRYTLLRIKRRREVLTRGMELIRRRREALTREFMGLVEECLKRREELTEHIQRAQRKLEFATAMNPASVESLSCAVKRDVSLEVRVKNIWGVNVPEIEEIPLSRGLKAMGVSALVESAQAIETALEFEGIMAELVKIASRETRLVRIGEMIRKDTRRINALEEVILPQLEKSLKTIERVLEEREREEVFRLKRYKARKRRY